MRRRLLLTTLTLVVALGSASSVALAGGGNSANAKLCQERSWQGLSRSDGTSFANEGECVSYAAQGGTLTPKSKSQLDCESYGGVFARGTSLWTCNGWHFADPGDEYAKDLTLVADCFADGGFAYSATNDSVGRNSTCSG
jgi:hypothetical protein